MSEKYLICSPCAHTRIQKKSTTVCVSARPKSQLISAQIVSPSFIMDLACVACAGVVATIIMSTSNRRAKKPPQVDTAPSLEGKVILITGGTTGLGKKSAIELARRRPAELWLTGRDMTRLEAAAADIRDQVDDAPPIRLLAMDLGSFKSVRYAAERFLAESPRLDILMLNAGVMSVPAGTTEDGYEVQFGTNHMGHALLTRLLEPALLAAKEAGPRVVVLSSSSHRDAPDGGIRWDTLKTSGRDIFIIKRYGQSKLANALFARALARRRPWLRVAAVHPGVVRGTSLQASATGIPFVLRHVIAAIRRFFTISLDDGVRNQIWASTDDTYPSGEYFEPVGQSGLANEYATNDELADQLWSWTEREFEAHGV